MISRYAIIVLVVAGTIPAFAIEPVKTDCNSSSVSWQGVMSCQLNDLLDFFTFSINKQQVIIEQNTQIEKLLIQQNKLQAYNYCIQFMKYQFSYGSVNDYVVDCTSKTLDATK